MNILETFLTMFYGTKAQCLHFYTYLDIESLMTLIPLCKYFEKQKKYIYKLVIGNIPFIPFPGEKMMFRKRSLYYRDVLKKLILKIKSNVYLREKSYLLNRTQKCLSHYTEDVC